MRAEYSFKIGGTGGRGLPGFPESCTVEPLAMGEPAALFTLKDGQTVSASVDPMPRVTPDRLTLVALSGFRPSARCTTG